VIDGAPEEDRRRRWSLRSAIILAAIALSVWVTFVVISIARESADREVSGRVTSVELHQVCVQPQTATSPTCVNRDSPADSSDVQVSDCVTMRYSSDEILIAVTPTVSC
jgi:ABC-type lipoprotein release transport system permease subunit